MNTTRLDLFPTKVSIYEDFLDSTYDDILAHVNEVVSENPDIKDKIEVDILGDARFSSFISKVTMTVRSNHGIQLRPGSSWINISTTQSYMGKHDHIKVLPEFCLYTAVYYPKVNADMGNLRLHDPNRFNHFINTYDQRYHDLPIRSNMLVVFPSWVDHEVLSNKSSIRTSIVVDLQTS